MARSRNPASKVERKLGIWVGWESFRGSAMQWGLPWQTPQLGGIAHNPPLYGLSSVQFSHSVFEIPWTAAWQASLAITNSWSLLRLMFIELVMPSNHPHPMSSPSAPTFNLSQHQDLFQWVSSSYQMAKVLELHHWSFQWIFRTDFL